MSEYMDTRTQNYLQGRFSDYYRRTDIYMPPKANEREWAYIPWTKGDNTIMARHKSLLDLGDITTFLSDRAPRHMYASAGKYKHPSEESSMSAKEWNSADLIFDLDADHFPGVDPTTTSMKTMLELCKDSLKQLIEFIEEDFGFTDTQIVFSGNRGYHLHVRDQEIQQLDTNARKEIVDYVEATGLNVDGLITNGDYSAVNSKQVRNKGGWGRHIHDRFTDWCDELLKMRKDDAISELVEYDNIAEGRAATFLKGVRNNRNSILDGNMEVGGTATRIIFQQFARQITEELSVPIDAPVTTDTRRLIRLPTSIHGGSGLIVTPIDKQELDTFDPLTDTIPDRFTNQEITISIEESQEFYLNNTDYNLTAGEHTVPEYVGVHLMTKGIATKESEI